MKRITDRLTAAALSLTMLLSFAGVPRIAAAEETNENMEWDFFEYAENPVATEGEVTEEYSGLEIHLNSGDGISQSGLYWNAPGTTTSDGKTVSNNRYIVFTPGQSGTLSVTFSGSKYSSTSKAPRMYIVSGEDPSCMSKTNSDANGALATATGANRETTVTAEVDAGKTYYIWPYYYNDSSCGFTVSGISYSVAVPEMKTRNIYESNMLLQRDQPVYVDGTCSAAVTSAAVSLINEATNETVQTVQAEIADKLWSAELDAVSDYENTYSMVISSDGMEDIVYTNIIFGDQYLFSGQSNMWKQVSYYKSIDADTYSTSEVSKHLTDKIRVMYTPGQSDYGTAVLQFDAQNKQAWRDFSSYNNIQDISAVAYKTAVKLYEETGVPIGVIDNPYPGSYISSWFDSALAIDNCNLGKNSNANERNWYCGRIYPLRNLKLSGIFWYQGCADAATTYHDDPYTYYSEMMARLITSWRELFGDDKLPFYYTQLTRIGSTIVDENNPDTGAAGKMPIKRAQTDVYLNMEDRTNVGLVGTLDVYGAYQYPATTNDANCRNDIHCGQKQRVGERMADMALIDIYNRDTDHDGNKLYRMGPIYKSSTAVGSSVVVTFDCNGSLAVMPPEQYTDEVGVQKIADGEFDPTILNEFELAGEDGIWYEAESEITADNQVTVRSDDVPEPVSVRYANKDYSESPNLTDESGLPSYVFSRNVDTAEDNTPAPTGVPEECTVTFDFGDGTSSRMTVSYGSTVDDIPQAPSKHIIALNDGVAAGNAVLVKAAYNEDNTLREVVLSDTIITENQKESELPASGDHEKYMLWDSVRNMKPLGTEREKQAVWILNGTEFTTEIPVYSDITVTAVYDDEEPVCPTAEPADVPAPVNVTVPAAASTYSSISVIWDKPEDYSRITGYEVYIDGNPAAVTAADETYYTAENLTPDTEYTFTVKSLTDDGKSNEAKAVTARTDIKGEVRNVMDAPYNASGDGVTLDTEAIQEAIDACGDNDIVLIPAGHTFITGALDLKSNMTLEVNGILKSSTNAADFEKKPEESDISAGGTSTGLVYTEEAPKRLIWSRVEGWEQYCYRSLINIGYLDENTDYSTDENYVCSNVKICGIGTITGDSSISNYAPISGNATALARAEGESAEVFYDIAASETTENNIRSRIRGRLINVSNAQNVYIKGITAANPPMWTVHMIYSDNVTTNGVTFNTSGCRNGDGWDPDSSTNCTIFNSRFNTGDDCIAIKSGKNPEGNTIARPAKNIRIIGCESEGGLGLAVGSEMSGGVEGVYVRDCVLSNTRYGIELKANKVRGGYIKDFHVQDSTVDRILIHSVTYNNDGAPAETSPVFSDMSFKNLNVIGYYGYDHTWLNTSIEIEGFADDNKTDDYYVKNVEFEDIILGTENNVTQNVSMKFCRDISFHNVLQSDGCIPLYAASDAAFTVNGGDIKDLVPEFDTEIEAERMNLENYVSETNSTASGGALVKINGSAVGTAAAAQAVYKGESGIKDICVTYFDESDGVDTYTLYVNDLQVDTWDADTNRGSDSPDERSLTNHITKDIPVKQGDTIRLTAVVKKSGSGRFDKLEIGEPGSFTEIGKEELPEGIWGSVDAENSIYTWTMGETETAAEAGAVYSDINDYADLTVSLGKGDSMYGGIIFSASSVKEPTTSGQANLNDTKRYLLVEPKYNGRLNITIAFSTAASNKKDRIYYADLGAGADISAVDLSDYSKGSHETVDGDIVSTSAVTKTIDMQAGHAYIIYTYQYGSTISALSYILVK